MDVCLCACAAVVSVGLSTCGLACLCAVQMCGHMYRIDTRHKYMDTHTLTDSHL